MTAEPRKLVYQFRITLLQLKTPVWRRIQVPEKYNFWDLHVAIQDAMGWRHEQMHRFEIKTPERKKPWYLGIPGPMGPDAKILSAWEKNIDDFFREAGDSGVYIYDFGDLWHHEILCEGILIRENSEKYPRCLAGERACPPEDCGGVLGYEKLLQTLSDPDSKAYQAKIRWLKHLGKQYFPYKPEAFDPSSVKFSNPKTRWKQFSEI